MRKKRVLIAASTYPPAFGGSGLEAHRLYRRLTRRLPIEVSALTQSGRGQPAGVDRHEGVRVRRVDPSRSLAEQVLTVGRLMLGRGVRSFDLVHAKDSSRPVLAACYWARVLAIPVIREMTLPSEGRVAAWKAALIRGTFSGARLLFAVNGMIRSEYIGMDAPEERIRMNPYPIDTDTFRFPAPEERADARSALGFVEGDVVHFVLGRIQPRKNQRMALQTLAQLPERHKLILAGPKGGEEYLNSIRTTMGEAGLRGRVVLLPEVQEDPLPLYHAADTYLLPSLQEGGPNAVFEALCCGLPVIVNEALGLDRYIEDGMNGFCVPLEAARFARAVRSLDDKVHDLRYRRAAAERSAQRYGAAALDPQYAQHIADLLKIRP